MQLLKPVIVAFSMFSAIPMPHIVWDEKSMRHSLIAFSLVGLLIGLLLWGGALLCDLLSLPRLVCALIFTTVPLIVTGGIHLDGFCDTWDAMASHREPSRMREILKDPHIGSFGVMHLILLLLAMFVLWAELNVTELVATPASLICPPVLSRALTGLSVASFPLAKGDGLARTFAENSDRDSVRIGCAAIAFATAVALVRTGNWTVAVAATLVFVWYRTRVLRKFGGLSGDLCGWFVQASELWMLAALYVTQVVEVVA